MAQLAVVAAMFHLFMHAFFKALLFLASGSVMHAMGDVIDMRRFRRPAPPDADHLLDVRRRRPGLAAIPPLSGFFSKDEVLLALSSAEDVGHEAGGGWPYGLIYGVASSPPS